MAENLIIRDATADDLPAVVALYFDDEHGSGRETVTDPLPAAYISAFAAIDAKPDARLIVIEMDGELVGTFQIDYLIGLSRGGTLRMQIEAVRVASARRGHGIGRWAMKWAISEARDKGCGLVQLTTSKTRGSAHKFYEQLGFTASHEGMKLLF